MKTDLEVEVEVDLGELGKVLIFRDKHTAAIIYRYHHYRLLHIRVAWAASREDLSHIIPSLPIADSHRHNNALFSILSRFPCLNKIVIYCIFDQSNSLELPCLLRKSRQSGRSRSLRKFGLFCCTSQKSGH